MSISIYLRPLREEDAATSYKWRNDTEIWVFTKFKANHPVSLQVERQWLKSCISSEKEKRFAICIEGTNQYIGNIQLLNLTISEAALHLFIGAKELWGKGLGLQATRQVLNYGFTVLELERIYLEVHIDNKAAISVYEKAGFKPVSTEKSFLKMEIDRERYCTRPE